MSKYVFIPEKVETTATGHVTDADLDRIFAKGRRDELPGQHQVAFLDSGRSCLNRKAASAQRGKQPLSRAISRINASSFEELLDALAEEDNIADLYESTTEPIDISAVEVDVRLQTVTYSVRHKTKIRCVGFKRLKTIFDSQLAS